MASTTGPGSTDRSGFLGPVDPYTFFASLRRMVRDAKDDDRDAQLVARTRTDRVSRPAQPAKSQR